MKKVLAIMLIVLMMVTSGCTGKVVSATDIPTNTATESVAATPTASPTEEVIEETPTPTLEPKVTYQKEITTQNYPLDITVDEFCEIFEYLNSNPSILGYLNEDYLLEELTSSFDVDKEGPYKTTYKLYDKDGEDEDLYLRIFSLLDGRITKIRLNFNSDAETRESCNCFPYYLNYSDILTTTLAMLANSTNEYDTVVKKTLDDLIYKGISKEHKILMSSFVEAEYIETVVKNIETERELWEEIIAPRAEPQVDCLKATYERFAEEVLPSLFNKETDRNCTPLQSESGDEISYYYSMSQIEDLGDIQISYQIKVDKPSDRITEFAIVFNADEKQREDEELYKKFSGYVNIAMYGLIKASMEFEDSDAFDDYYSNFIEELYDGAISFGDIGAYLKTFSDDEYEAVVLFPKTS